MLTFDNYRLKMQDRPISLSIYGHTIINIIDSGYESAKCLLRAIAGLPSKTYGSILYHKDRRPLYIGNAIGLYQNLRVIDNLMHWARIYRSEHAVPIAIKYFDLAKILRSKNRELPIVEQKKVLLSKAFICPSSIWLLDEPFVNLAPECHEMLTNAILAKCDQGGIIFVNGNLANNRHHLIFNLARHEALNNLPA